MEEAITLNRTLLIMKQGDHMFSLPLWPLHRTIQTTRPNTVKQQLTHRSIGLREVNTPVPTISGDRKVLYTLRHHSLPVYVFFTLFLVYSLLHIFTFADLFFVFGTSRWIQSINVSQVRLSFQQWRDISIFGYRPTR